MLYRPKWDNQASAITLEGLIAWLETQDPEQTYDSSDHTVCMVAQFCKTIGVEPPLVLTGDIADIAFSGKEIPCTFGDALVRARKIARAAWRTHGGKT
jgi:hypothetical protein